MYQHKRTDIELQELISNLAAHYKQASDELQAKAESFMAKYLKEKKAMETKLQDGEVTKKFYDKWLREQTMTEKWYREMIEQLSNDMVDADIIANQMINNSLIDVYADNFNFGTFEAEKLSGIDTSFTLYDNDTVYNLISKNRNVIPFASINLNKEVRWIRGHISNAITQGILQGESIDKIAIRIQAVSNMNYNAAVRTARTLTTSAENKGRIDSYRRAKDFGIPIMKQWIATLDSRTRDSHRVMDLQTKEIDDPFIVDGFMIDFPADIGAEDMLKQNRNIGEVIYNCRCTLVGIIKGFEYDYSKRQSNLGKQSYGDWKSGKDD